MGADTNLIGVSSLLVKLDAMGAMEDGQILKTAAREGMRTVYKSAIAKIPRGTREHYIETLTSERRKGKGNYELVQPGYASKHVRMVVWLSKDKQAVFARVGTTLKAYYATQFVERGHRTRNGGIRVEGHPWLRPAFYENQNNLKEKVRATFEVFLEKICAEKS